MATFIKAINLPIALKTTDPASVSNADLGLANADTQAAVDAIAVELSTRTKNLGTILTFTNAALATKFNTAALQNTVNPGDFLTAEDTGTLYRYRNGAIDPLDAANWAETGGAQKKFITFANNYVAKNGDLLWWVPGRTLNFKSMKDGEYVVAQARGSTGLWSETDATWPIDMPADGTIFPDGALKVEGSDVLTLSWDATNNQVVVSLGADKGDTMQRQVSTLDDLAALDVSRFQLGSMVAVTQEAANNGVYIAVRDDNADTIPTRWGKQ